MPEGKKETYSSIFDAAAKIEKEKAHKKEVAEKADIEKVSVPTEPATQVPEKRDLKAAFENCKKLHDSINNKLDQAMEHAKISPNQIREYINTPSNFSDKQWKLIESEKKELEKKLTEFAPISETESETKEPASKKKKEYKPKGMLAKSRWIQMH